MGSPAHPDFDYIVIGSGAGGGPVAANLARAGYKVGLIEAGHDFRSVFPNRAFTSTTRALPQVCESGTLSVVTSLVPRGPYCFSYSASHWRTGGA